MENNRNDFIRYLMENPSVYDYGYAGRRYYNVLNVDYQADQFRKRLVRYEIDSRVQDLLKGRLIWLSKQSLDYFKANGNWGKESLFTMVKEKDEEGKTAYYSIKPKWAI